MSPFFKPLNKQRPSIFAYAHDGNLYIYDPHKAIFFETINKRRFAVESDNIYIKYE